MAAFRCALVSLCLLNSCQLLQQSPVFQPLLFSGQQRCGGVAVFIEVLGETAFRTSKGDEVNRLAGLGVHVPVVFHVWISGQTQTLFELWSLTRIINEEREAA